MKELFYFGCIREAGHYLFAEGERNLWHKGELLRRFSLDNRFFDWLDGLFVPHVGNVMPKQGIYRESVVPPLRIVTWADFTVDTRPGCNSNLIGFGYTSVDEIFADAMKSFPSVMKRQTVPLTPFVPA